MSAPLAPPSPYIPPSPPPLPPPGDSFWDGVNLQPTVGTSTGAGFGRAVSVSRNVIAVGAREEGSRISNGGAVFLFDRVTGRMEHILHPNDPAMGSFFGDAVALPTGQSATDETLALVLIGSPSAYSGTNNLKCGAAYLFSTSDGTQQQKLAPSDGAAYDEFGKAVAMHAGKAVVGAPNHAVSGLNAAGAIYVYDANTGTQERKIEASDAASFSSFGAAVAVHLDRILVGAPRMTTNSAGAGAAYLFKLSDGTEVKKVLPPPPTNGDRFGSAVALYDGGGRGKNSDLAAMIGAPRRALRTGAAFWYEKVSGNQDPEEIENNRAKVYEEFGTSVSLFENVALIGAPKAFSKNGVESGIVRLWTKSHARRLVAADGDLNNQFGHSVAIYEDTMVVGVQNHISVPLAAGLRTVNGAAYLFQQGPTPLPPLAPPIPPAKPPDAPPFTAYSPVSPPATEQVALVFGVVAAVLSGCLFVVLLCTLSQIVKHRSRARAGTLPPPRPELLKFDPVWRSSMKMNLDRNMTLDSSEPRAITHTSDTRTSDKQTMLRENGNVHEHDESSDESSSE